jgi:hypothetical protein
MGPAHPAQHCVHPPRHLLLPLLEHVPAGVRGQHDVLCPKRFLTSSSPKSPGEQERRCRVAHVVEAGVWELGAVEGVLERA